MNCPIRIILALMMSGGGALSAQVESPSPEKVPLAQLIDGLEANEGIRIFYPEPGTDTVFLDGPAATESTAELLERIRDRMDWRVFRQEEHFFFFSRGILDPTRLISFRKADSSSAPPGAWVTFEEKSDAKQPDKLTDRNRILVIGSGERSSSRTHATLNGYVRESETGEPIIGAVVFNEKDLAGVTTDRNGYYVITLDKGRHQVTYRSMGKREEYRNLQINGDGSLNIEMDEKINRLKGVVITADKYQNVSGMQIGLNKIDVSTIRRIPANMGEADVLKAALLLPGVQTVGEGASGFNVRGGSTDQNLILLNGAPVFNTSHLFGFFSAFNPDVIKDFKLYKSGINAEYGGRISSVFDISTRNGNRKEFSGMGGISPVTGRLTLEGPVVRDKLSLIAGARSTYSDWLLRRIPDPAIRNSAASFYDLHARVSWDINEKNQLDLSGYNSKDFFRLNSDTTYEYTNANIVLGWKHVFSQKIFARFSGIYSRYQYRISSPGREIESFDMRYRIGHRELKGDLTYFLLPAHTLKMGANFISYSLRPGSFSPLNDRSLVAPLELEKENAFESALYASDEYQVNTNLSIYAGIRYSFYGFLGPKTVRTYFEGVPLDPIHIADTLRYGKGDWIQGYNGPEWRAGIRYKIPWNSSVKLSYNRMRQYLHMLSNTTAVSPTDTWKLSDNHIRPQVGDQLAAGIYKDFRRQGVETSIEFYYKKIRDLIEYKGGAQLLLNEGIEQDLINASGRAYGAEIMVERTMGKLTGWISYTYSRIEVKADSEFPLERINGGDWFPANHDKPHDLTAVGTYRFSRRFSISTNLTYSTGRPITYPVARYRIRNMNLLHYTRRNEFRIPDYFRWDLSANIEGNLRSEKLAHSSWSFSVYNVTGRDNVYSIYFVTREDRVNGYKLSVFTQPIFTLTYNFKF